MANGNGTVTGLPRRAENLTIGVVAAISLAIAAFYAGVEWRDLRKMTDEQEKDIAAFELVVTKTNTSLAAINKSIELLSARIDATRHDPWRGEDMREYGEQAEDLNDGWRSPDIYALPGYQKRNRREQYRR